MTPHPGSRPHCDEGRTSLSRRSLLRMAGGAGGLGLATVTLGDARLAFGATTDTDTLVVLSLRGGSDGLSVVVPFGDPGYAPARPNIAVPASAVKRIDSVFGLHPALAPLFGLWDAGKIAAVHAVGQAVPTRSHAEAMQEMERAAPKSAVRTGWIDRVTGLIPAPTTFTAAQVGNPNLPAALAGAHQKFAMGTLDSIKVEVSDSIVPLAGWQDALTLLHHGAAAPVSLPMTAAMAAVGQVQGFAPARSAIETGYPATNLGLALHDVARLIKAGVGLRVAAVDFDDWDMHADLGKPEQGWMVDQLTELSNALMTFAKDLGPDLDRVTLVTLSEFGRRVAENGSGGLDHGHGNAVLVIGGAVNGGKVYGNWPTLAADKLDDGDLAVTTDYRQILAELLTKRCGIGSAAAVFPGLTPAPLGLVDARPA